MQSWQLRFVYGPEGDPKKEGEKRPSLGEIIRIFRTADGRPVSVYSKINVPDLRLGETEERLKKLKETLEK